MSNSNAELRPGHFLFTPLQSILINKRMPDGFKLESEENLVKVHESAKPSTKKPKTSVNYINLQLEPPVSNRERGKL
jgi:hypothetical protein